MCFKSWPTHYKPNIRNVLNLVGNFVYFDRHLVKRLIQLTLKVLEGKLKIEAHLGDCVNSPEPQRIHLQLCLVDRACIL